MTGANQTELGDVQRTLFFPLLARARETARKHPLLRDPKAAELVAALVAPGTPMVPSPLRSWWNVVSSDSRVTLVPLTAPKRLP